MGNRILKESILTSRKVSSLSWFEQVMFDHLIVTADDYGICQADPVLLSRLLFPRNTGVSEKQIQEGLKHMEAQELILRYTVDGEEYLKLISWEKHQRLRSSRRKHPGPEEADPAPETKEPALPADTAPEPDVRELPVAELPLNDNTCYGVTREEADEYATLYPAVDILQEFRNMRGWCLANMQKRKTRSGIRKFINNWLARAQNKACSQSRGLPPDPFLEPLPEETEGRSKADVWI